VSHEHARSLFNTAVSIERGCGHLNPEPARSWGLSTRTDVGVTDAGRWRLAQIRRAYRNLITKEHPDKGGDPEKFALIQRAYDVLSSDAKRRQYDTTGKAEKTADEELLDSFGGGASHVAPAVVHSSR
jgi:hypothetical protein